MSDRELELPVEPSSVDAAHDALDRLWADEPSVSDLDRFRFTTAFVEIVGNVVEHAYQLDHSGDRLLGVRLSVRDDAVEAVIEDNGRPASIDLAAVTMPDEDAESGRGLALALQAVDDLRYERLGGRNRWTVTCRRAD